MSETETLHVPDCECPPPYVDCVHPPCDCTTCRSAAGGVTRYLPICQPCIDGEGSECHTPECAFFLRDVPTSGANEVMALDGGETEDGQANDCTHGSATGIDTTSPRDPTKVWRCDHCGLRWRSDGQPTPADRAEPVESKDTRRE